MPKKADRLLTYQDISDATGITVGALRKRKCLGTMPEPDLFLGGTPVWREGAIAAWLKRAAPSVRQPRRAEVRSA